MTKLLLTFALAGSLGAQTLSLNPHAWATISLKVRTSDLALVGNGKITLSNAPDGSLQFAFPTVASDGKTFQTVNYLTTAYRTPLTNATQLVIAISVTTTGAPVFHWETQPDNNCNPAVQYCTPDSLRPIINGYGDRWFADDVTYDLSTAPRMQTLSVPLDPWQWSGVYGTRAATCSVQGPTNTADCQVAGGTVNIDAAWLATLSNPVYVGLVCGGGYFFGHGCFETGGAAQFQLLSYSIFR